AWFSVPPGLCNFAAKGWCRGLWALWSGARLGLNAGNVAASPPPHKPRHCAGPFLSPQQYLIIYIAF
ncbi:hypothetical protein ACUNFT_25920, partial [Serratia sp. IR-2025]